MLKCIPSSGPSVGHFAKRLTTSSKRGRNALVRDAKGEKTLRQVRVSEHSDQAETISLREYTDVKQRNGPQQSNPSGARAGCRVIEGVRCAQARRRRPRRQLLGVRIGLGQLR